MNHVDGGRQKLCTTVKPTHAIHRKKDMPHRKGEVASSNSCLMAVSILDCPPRVLRSPLDTATRFCPDNTSTGRPCTGRYVCMCVGGAWVLTSATSSSSHGNKQAWWLWVLGFRFFFPKWCPAFSSLMHAQSTHGHCAQSIHGQQSMPAVAGHIGTGASCAQPARRCRGRAHALPPERCFAEQTHRGQEYWRSCGFVAHYCCRMQHRHMSAHHAHNTQGTRSMTVLAVAETHLEASRNRSLPLACAQGLAVCHSKSITLL